jgi:hypothetical protein
MGLAVGEIADGGAAPAVVAEDGACPPSGSCPGDESDRLQEDDTAGAEVADQLTLGFSNREITQQPVEVFHRRGSASGGELSPHEG